MLGFVVYLILFLGSLFAFVVALIKKKECAGILIVPLYISFCTFLIFSIEWGSKSSEERKFAMNYATTRSIIESNGFNQQTFLVKSQIFQKAQYIDIEIERNKRKSGNLWNGRKFSEKIGQYELLTPIFNKNEKNSETLWDSYVN